MISKIWDQKHKKLKKKKDKFNFIKTKTFCASTDIIIRKMRRQFTKLEKYLQIIYLTTVWSRIYKEQYKDK